MVGSIFHDHYKTSLRARYGWLQCVWLRKSRRVLSCRMSNNGVTSNPDKDDKFAEVKINPLEKKIIVATVIKIDVVT